MNSANLITNLIKELSSGDTWGVLAFVAFFGAVGGLTHKIIFPKEDTSTFFGHLFSGGVAAIAVLLTSIPSDAVKLISLSIVAGFSAKSVLNALSARLNEKIAKSDLFRAKEEKKDMIRTARKLVQEVQGALETPGQSIRMNFMSGADDSSGSTPTSKATSDLMASLNRFSGYLDKVESTH